MVLSKNPQVPWLCISPLLLLNPDLEGVTYCHQRNRGRGGGWTIFCLKMLASLMYEWGGVRQLYGSHAQTTSFLCACLEITHKSRPPRHPQQSLCLLFSVCLLVRWETWEEILSPGFQLHSLTQNSWFHLIYVLKEIQAIKDVLWKKVIPSPNSEQAI